MRIVLSKRMETTKVGRYIIKKNPNLLFVGMLTDSTFIENNMEISKKQE